LARRAIVVANSVAEEGVLKGTPKTQARRAAEQISRVLSLPSEFSFEVTELVDAGQQRVRNAVSNAARACRGNQDLLLFFYFGHGRRTLEGLSFIHPSGGSSRELLDFRTLFHLIRAENPRNVLFVLDCCYAGAAAMQLTLPEAGFCVLACTSPSTRAFWEKRGEAPIGYFTGAFLDAFADPGAAVSLTDDSITTDSLFQFLVRKTRELSQNAQVPYAIGRLNIEIARFQEEPILNTGFTEDVSPKSAYSKIFAVVDVLSRRNRPYDDLESLYRTVIAKHQRAFLTNYIDDRGSISQQPASWTVLRTYIPFLRSLKIVDDEELRLTPRGADLINGPRERYNQKLLLLLDRWFGSLGLDRDSLRAAIVRVVARRWMPTRHNVLAEINLIARQVPSERTLSLGLDMYGYIGVFGMLRRRDQVYFPWSKTPRRRGR
jgi:hypothetical protein